MGPINPIVVQDLSDLHKKHTPWESNPTNRTMLQPGLYPTYKRKNHMVHLRPVRNKTAGLCGHKIDTGNLPKTQCPGCWGHFFVTNQDMTVNNIKLFNSGQVDDLKYELGKRYVKMLGGFIEFVKVAKAEQDANKLTEVESVEVPNVQLV